MNIGPFLEYLNRPGIYMLEFKSKNSIYIGQSRCLGSRIFSHLGTKLKAPVPTRIGKQNEKLNKALSETFLSDIEVTILETCSRYELHEKEKFWIEKFRSENMTLLNKTQEDYWAARVRKTNRRTLSNTL